MLSYRVEDMTCAHCADVITNAIRKVDGTATVTVDIPRHLVFVEGRQADAAAFATALNAAGYDAAVVESAGDATASAGATGCCCSGRAVSRAERV